MEVTSVTSKGQAARRRFETGIDLADALHHASHRSCTGVATVDERRFARRAKKLGLAPAAVARSLPAA